MAYEPPSSPPVRGSALFGGPMLLVIDSVTGRTWPHRSKIQPLITLSSLPVGRRLVYLLRMNTVHSPKLEARLSLEVLR
jgi:hypothetical protein